MQRETRLVNVISVCAEAHPCVELVHSDNRVRWGTLFMPLIWLRKQIAASTKLKSAPLSVFCISLWLCRKKSLYNSKLISYIRLVSFCSGKLQITGDFFVK